MSIDVVVLEFGRILVVYWNTVATDFKGPRDFLGICADCPANG